MSESGQHGYHLSWEQFEPSACRICTNSPDFLSELNGPVGHPVGVWRNCMLFLETPQMWCQGNPDSLPLCFGSSGESWGQGSNESRALHPEAVTSYQYFQSSKQNRKVYQVGCDRVYLVWICHPQTMCTSASHGYFYSKQQINAA